MGDFFDLKSNALPPSFTLREHYLIREVIGYGGFGITYSAFDTGLQIPVAVKELYLRKICRRGPGAVVTAPDQYREQYDLNKKYFLEEARVLAQLGGRDLPGIVSVRDFFEENNTAYIVMELLSGVTLREYIRQKGGRIPGQQICMLLNDAAQALAVMHDRGIIHKDISPDNIMILTDGGARLLDFGCAMRIDSEQIPAQLSYRRGYAAPEQYSFEGKPGKSSDVYSLGATIYYCLTGRNPVDAKERLKGRSLPPPGETGAETGVVSERVVLKAMDLRQGRRYADAREFWEEFRESVFLRRTAGSVRMDKKRLTGRGKNKERKGKLKAAIVISLLVSAAAGFFVLGIPSVPGRSAGDSRLREIVPEEGLYQLVSCAGQGPMLHVKDDSLQEGAFLDVREGEGSSGIFLVKPQEHGCSIRCTGNKNGSNYQVSILDDSPESGAYLCQRREDGSERQCWTFWEDTSNNVYIYSYAGTLMDAEKASMFSEESVRLRDFTGSVYQKWKLFKVPDENE